MDYGFTDDLFFTAGAAFIVCLFLLLLYLPNRLALVIALIKISIPFVYFGMYRHHWSLLDDMTYMKEGSNLVALQVSPLQAITTAGGFRAMTFQVGTAEILYPWVNLTAFTLLGVHYYAPVFINITLSCLCGFFAYRIALNIGVDRSYARWYMVLFLLHWDLLTWTSLINIKDTWALFIVVMFFYAFQLVFQLKTPALVKGGGFLLMLFAVALSVFLRLYLAFSLLVSCGIWSVIYDRGPRRYVSGVLTVLAIVLFIRSPFDIARQFNPNPFGILLGSVHFFTTPQPLGIDPDYAFLQAATWLHWAFFIPTAWGAVHIHQRLPQSRIFIVFGIFLVIFYGMYDAIGLGGPRQRLQLLPSMALFQFEFLWFYVAPRFGALSSQVFRSGPGNFIQEPAT